MASLFDRYQKEKRIKKREQKTTSARAEAADPTIGNTLAIERLSHEGRGVARDSQGKTVFVRGALPGERVTAQITQSRSRYNDAVISTIQQPSVHRVEPKCKHYSECGGCSLQHLNHEQQVAFKQATITEHFKRENVALPQAAEPAILSPAYGYRRKARLGVTCTKSQGLVIGFRERNSKTLTPIQHCEVLEPRLQPLIPALQTLVPALKGKGDIGHVELIADENGCHVIVRAMKKLPATDIGKWQAWAQQYKIMLWLEDNAGKSAPMFPEGNTQNDGLRYQLNDITLQFQPSDFLQINAAVNQAMVAQALNWLQLSGQERVLDLFSGFGNFTLPLAKQCQQIIGIEGVSKQVKQATRNAAINKITNANFYQADLNAALHTFDWAKEPFDVVVLDPPRAGAELVCTAITQLAPQQILYISCNPATLARDAALLAQHGYTIVRYGMLDMFPQTAHAESMVLFKKM